MKIWTDRTGRTLEVIPADDAYPARLTVTFNESRVSESAVFWLDGETDLAEVAMAMFAANGKPAPVILPGVALDTSVTTSPHGIDVWLAEGGGVMIEGTTAGDPLDERGAFQVAAVIAVYAQASRARKPEPDAADVYRMASLFTEASRMAPEDAARYLLRAGVTLPGGGGRNG